jgi:hypothetical protein
MYAEICADGARILLCPGLSLNEVSACRDKWLGNRIALSTFEHPEEIDATVISFPQHVFDKETFTNYSLDLAENLGAKSVELAVSNC